MVKDLPWYLAFIDHSFLSLDQQRDSCHCLSWW